MMRMILGFIEAKVTVIDATIQSQETIDYLVLICSSPAHSQIFSRIVYPACPHAIIEEMTSGRVEEYLSTRAVRGLRADRIPHFETVRSVTRSKRFLLALLLEYRALMSETGYIPPLQVAERESGYNCDLRLPFLLVEMDNRLCGIPDFQINTIQNGANGAKIVSLDSSYGHRLLVCNDVLCIKELDVPSIRVTGKIDHGLYACSSFVQGKPFPFSLILPALMQ